MGFRCAAAHSHSPDQGERSRGSRGPRNPASSATQSRRARDPLSGYPVHRATAPLTPEARDTSPASTLSTPADLLATRSRAEAIGSRHLRWVTSGKYTAGVSRERLRVGGVSGHPKRFPSCSSLGIRRYHHSNRPYDRSSNGTRLWMQDQGKLVELIPRRDLPSRAAVPSLMSDAQPSWRSSASPCYLAVSSSRRQASRRPR